MVCTPFSRNVVNFGLMVIISLGSTWIANACIAGLSPVRCSWAGTSSILLLLFMGPGGSLSTPTTGHTACPPCRPLAPCAIHCKNMILVIRLPSPLIHNDTMHGYHRPCTCCLRSSRSHCTSAGLGLQRFDFLPHRRHILYMILHCDYHRPRLQS